MIMLVILYLGIKIMFQTMCLGKGKTFPYSLEQENEATRKLVREQYWIVLLVYTYLLIKVKI